MVVLDCNYNIVGMKEAGEKKDIEFLAPEDGKYIVRIAGENAGGHFEMKINSDGNFTTKYKDLFS